MADQQKIKQTETEIYQREGRRWPALILLLLAALLIATAVTLAGRWLYREISGSEDEAAETTSDSADFDSNGAREAAPADPANPNGGDSGSNESTDGSGGGDEADDSEAPQTAPATGDENLPSTGG